MNVAKTIFEVIERDNLVQHAETLGQHAIKRLAGTASIQSKVKAIRGKGLFLGLEFKEEPKDFVAKGLESRVILNVTQKTVARIAPAINITMEEWDEGLSRLIKTIEAL